MTSLVLTVIGDDRPGLVSAVSALVEARGGSWQRSQMTRLSGKFAGIALVEVPDAQRDGLEEALAGLAAEGLVVHVEDAGGDAAPAGRAPAVVAPAARRTGPARHRRRDLLGARRPGGSGSRSCSPTSSRRRWVAGCSSRPTRGSRCPQVPDVGVRADLERLADELMVDLELDAD